MKIQKHNNTLETNSTGESKSFGIGDASVVIEILRNRLYENKVQTLVQEYICNARDAMREIGKGNDFEVTMPTRLAPTFKVRDYGMGISPDRMEKVFILYGASTKRGNNTQTGGFGIGAKSAWSYTDSFTVVTIVDGTRRTYVCHTGHNNQGSMDLVSTDDTSEANGTEIQIAVRREDIEEFRAAVYRAIYFWESRPTVNGGGEELPALASGYKVTDNVETMDKNAIPRFIGLDYSAKALAVIDGVAYPLTEKLLNKATKLGKFINDNLRKTLILHFPNGLVEVSASRESIADSQFTIDSLNRMGEQGAKAVTAHIKSEFSKVNSVETWVATYRALESYFHVQDHAKYGDYVIQHGAVSSLLFNEVRMTIVHDLDKRRRYKVDRITKDEITRNESKEIDLELLNQIYFVSAEETKIVQNKRFREFLKNQRNSQLSKVILLEVNSNDSRVALDKIIADLGAKDLATLTYVEAPKAERVKIERENEEFCMHGFLGSRFIHTTLARNTQKYLYVEAKNGNYGEFNRRALSELSYHLSDTLGIKVVGLAERAVKMVKGDANFSPLKDWLTNFKPSKAEVNFALRESLKNTEEMTVVAEITGIKDKFLVEMAKEYKGLTGEARKFRSLPDLLISKVREAVDAKEFLANDEKLEKLLNDQYPLISKLVYNNDKKVRTELAIYINAKYND